MTEPRMEPAWVIQSTLGIPASRLRVWAIRYTLPRQRDTHGKMLYDFGAVCRIARATRPERQRRLPRKPRTLV